MRCQKKIYSHPTSLLSSIVHIRNLPKMTITFTLQLFKIPHNEFLRALVVSMGIGHCRFFDRGTFESQYPNVNGRYGRKEYKINSIEHWFVDSKIRWRCDPLNPLNQLAWGGGGVQ